MRLLELLFSATGTIDRVRYAVVGVVALFLKHIIDIAVAIAFHSVSFFGYYTLFSYWIPLGQPLDITRLSLGQYLFLSVLVAVSVPFVWIGVATTIKRLRALEWPLWLTALFFAPVVNVIFFVLLVALPDAAEVPADIGRRNSQVQRVLDRVMPANMFAAGAMTSVLTAVFGTAAIVLSTVVFKEYGWGVFVAVPVCQGILASLLWVTVNRDRPSTAYVLRNFSVLLGAGLLLAIALEGLLCILMAAPLALLLAAIGAVIGYQIQLRPSSARSAAVFAVALLAAPASMAADYAAPQRPPLFTVRTAVVVNAPPEVVWRSTVRFPELPPPSEPVFRAGIAYPIRARIDGSGVGATRYCQFSTGDFVEPITIWDEPHRLGFDVAHNPEPMRELSPYGHIVTPHLHGFLVAERGEFRLEPLAGGRTRLVGTTWYRDNVWPASYWRLWSDPLIHAIHARVLEEIKRSSEEHAHSPSAGSNSR